jgi:hypothetical protein
LRSAIAIRPKALGCNNEVAYRWRLGSPGVTAAWSVRLRRICVKRAVGDHPAIVFLVILSPLCIVLKSATEAAPDLPDTLRQVWRAPP